MNPTYVLTLNAGVYWYTFALLLVLSPLLPLIRSEFAVSYAGAGLLMTALELCFSLSRFPSGLLSIRVGLKRVMVFGLLISAVAAFSLSLVESYPTLLVVLIVLGMALGIPPTIGVGMIALAYPPEKRGRAQGVLQTGASAGVLSAYFIAGLLAEHYGWRLTYAVLGPVGLCLAVLFVVSLRQSAYGETSRAVRSRDVIREVIRNKAIMGLFVPFILFHMTVTGTTSMIPLYMVGVHGIDVTTTAMLLLSIQVGGLCGALIWGILADKLGTLRVISILMLMMSLSIVLFFYSPFGYQTATLLFLWGFSAYPVFSVTWAHISIVTDQILRTASVGFFASTGMVIGSFGALIAGLITDVTGFATTFHVLAAMVGAGSLMTAKVRKVRE
ncbi:MAG: MFS transporter [Aigarchaeota archaeon]|nr:MFS transporter [Aigarchaeota archaeon]MDW8092234.1 MFS transporter [Nitrososphaerota archaeon]